MLARDTLVGLLAAVMMGLMVGQAGAGGGFQMLDLKSIVNMDWRDEVRVTAGAAGPTRAIMTCGRSAWEGGNSWAFPPSRRPPLSSARIDAGQPPR